METLKVFQLVNSDGLVVNSIVVDPTSGTFTPPQGYALVETRLAGIGDKIINGEIYKRVVDEEGKESYIKLDGIEEE